MRTSFAAALAAILLLQTPATAASLTGDTVSARLSASGIGQIIGLGAIVVGAGADGSASGNGGTVSLDFDAGLLADEFAFSSSKAYSSWVGGGGTMTLVLGDLDFGADTQLTGFDLLSSVFSDTLVTAVTSDSVTLSFTDGAFGKGEFLRGRFLTAAIGAPEAGTSAVPLPAGLPMLLGGLATLGFMRRRRG